MVKFEFEMSDIDAQNLVQLLHDDEVKWNVAIQDAICDGDDKMKEVYLGQIKYTKGLIATVVQGSKYL